MGAYNRAEICELVGICLLSLFSENDNKKDIDLYRDDGLAAFRNVSGPQSEKIKKNFQQIFRENDLEIVISCNMKIVNYLDVTLNLNDGTYRPYHKPNNEIMYIHSESNHPAIIKQLQSAIESRLCNISSSEDIFNESAKVYQDALTKSGFKHAVEEKEKSEKEYNLV